MHRRRKCENFKVQWNLRTQCPGIKRRFLSCSWGCRLLSCLPSIPPPLLPSPPPKKRFVHQDLIDAPKHSFFCITNYQLHRDSLIMSSNWIETGAKYLRWSGHWQEGLSTSFSIRNQHVSRLLELLCTYWLMAIIYYSAEDLALS